jgi:hypothetical protein
LDSQGNGPVLTLARHYWPPSYLHTHENKTNRLISSESNVKKGE